MKKNYCFILFFIFTASTAWMQAQTAIAQWRDHLPYKQGVAIAESPTRIYVGTENAMFEYIKNESALHRVSKVNGLSDNGVSTLGYNSYNAGLLIGYKNGNIDVLQNNTFFNVSDVKRSTIIGNKKINSVYFNGRYAYLACGFGIIYFDTERMEVKDTYFIGYNGGQINIRDITINNNIIYAASDSGVYSASLSSPNLADFASWSRITALPRAIFNTICVFNGNIYTNLSKFLTATPVFNQDTLYQFNGSAWNYFPPETTGFTVHSLEVSNGQMVVTYNGVYKVFDNTLTATSIVGPFQTGFPIDPRQAIINAAGEVWAADYQHGLIKFTCQGWCNKRLLPNGPETAKVYAMSIEQGRMWVAPGERTDLWINQYNADGIFIFKEESWSVLNGANTPLLLPIRDIVSVVIDPLDPEHVYAGCLGSGLIEFNNNVVTNIYNQNNSSLQVRGDAPTSGWVGSFGSAFDKDGNLWVTNSLAPDPLSVKKTDGTWQAFNFGSLLGNSSVGSIIVTQANNQKWMVLPRGGGILVFSENGTWSSNDDSYKKLGTAVGLGGLPSAEVYCLAEDKDGEIWVGTDKGIAVFYSPDNIFNTNPSDAQQILIDQDGQTQILLETEQVSVIAIDGANRKWIGTQGAGVFLMSADGTTEIHHFDENNSPLFSNSITSISINGETGEVFFGTSKGIISYKSTATEGLDDFTDVYAYPNPVRPGYNGPIAIKGLVKDCDVKITDITGTLVYQTTALGGQAIWDGKNFNGDKAHSGVYLVFCSNEDGSKTYVTKICVVN